jgi:hypothetical protein
MHYSFVLPLKELFHSNECIPMLYQNLICKSGSNGKKFCTDHSLPTGVLPGFVSVGVAINPRQILSASNKIKAKDDHTSPFFYNYFFKK